MSIKMFPVNNTVSTINRREFGAGVAALLAGACFGSAREPIAFDIPKIGPERDALVTQLAQTDHVTLLKMCHQLCASQLKDYSGTMVSQECINGLLLPERTVAYKFRQEPYSVLLEYLSGAPEVAPTIFSRKLIYVEGQNGGNMRVYVRSVINGESLDLPRAFNISPTDGEVAKNSKKPITEFGFLKGLEAAIAVYEEAAKRGELKEQSLYEKTTVDGRPCVTLKRVLSESAAPVDPMDYKLKHATSFTILDMGYLLPIEYVGYNKAGKLECSFKIKIEKFNQGLEDKDFMPQQ